MAGLKKAEWALEYRREGREIRVLLNEGEVGRVKYAGMSIMTEAELEEYNERLITTTLEMAADSLRLKATTLRDTYGSMMTLPQYHLCDGIEAAADEIDPRKGETGA